MTIKKFNKLMDSIKDGEADFFFNTIDIVQYELNTLNRMQLLIVIQELNRQMISSTDNWEGG